eukprot:COSAG01_NODE_379_length_17872_cov_8.030102_10_plen_131_part_00
MPSEQLSNSIDCESYMRPSKVLRHLPEQHEVPCLEHQLTHESVFSARELRARTEQTGVHIGESARTSTAASTTTTSSNATCNCLDRGQAGIIDGGGKKDHVCTESRQARPTILRGSTHEMEWMVGPLDRP